MSEECEALFVKREACGPPEGGTLRTVEVRCFGLSCGRNTKYTSRNTRYAYVWF